MSMAVRPGLAPTAKYSPIRIWYLRLERMTVVTGSFSRACVQRPCTVYIAEPSACRPSTRRRFRRARSPIAAPIASGTPSPIAPPMICSQSCGAAQWVFLKKPRP